jgi:hypothetical protein
MILKYDRVIEIFNPYRGMKGIGSTYPLKDHDLKTIFQSSHKKITFKMIQILVKTFLNIRFLLGPLCSLRV